MLTPQEPRLIIIGCGIAGIALSARLRSSLGYQNFTIYEREDSIGGTWFLNTYPGVGCDVDSHLCSFSFNLNPHWSKRFAEQPEILQYLNDTVDKFGVRPHVRLGVEVIEATWAKERGVWSVRLHDLATGHKFTREAEMLVSCVGTISIPKECDIPGAKEFQGTMFHSARWNHKFDMRGKKVAVIGNGCSGAQLMPYVANTASTTYQFQRSAQWINERPKSEFTALQKACLRYIPFVHRLQWRLPVAIQIVFSGLVLVSTLFIPETPRWPASQNRVEEARNVIARLLNRPEDDEAVTGQLTEILDALATETEGEQAVGWLEVFSNRTKSRNLHRVLIGMGPYMMNQWSGTNALTYYLAYILREYLDFSQSLSLILASVAFTIYFLLAIPPYFYIDRIDRRWTIMLSSTGCAACMAIIAGCLIHRVYSNTVAAVAFMFLYLGVFAMGILPVSWSYSAEVQPLHCRSKATAVRVFSHWMSNFVVVMVTPVGLSSIGGHYFWIWAVVCASFVPLIWFFGVETAGRTLEQVDQMFYDNPRMLMGLNPENRRVWRPSKADEETHFRAVNEKVKNEDVSYIENMDVKR